MKIGPVDIRNHAFVKRAMRGVDEAEVRAYLDLVADGLQESILEAEELRTRIDKLEREIVEYRGLEQTLRESLLSASKITDDRLAQAEKEAQILIKDAEVQGDKLLLRSREEAGRLRAAVDDLRRQRTTYVERFRALLRSQMKILEASVATFDPDSPEAAEYRDVPAIPPAPAAPPPMPPGQPPSWASSPHVPPHGPPPVPPADPPLGSYAGEGGRYSTSREGDASRDA